MYQTSQLPFVVFPFDYTGTTNSYSLFILFGFFHSHD